MAHHRLRSRRVGLVAATFLINVTNTRTQTLITLSTEIVSTVVGASVAAGGLIESARNRGQSPRIVTQEQAPATSPTRVMSAEVLSEYDSLEQFISLSRVYLAELRHNQTAPFIPLTAALDDRQYRDDLLLHVMPAAKEVRQARGPARAEPIELTKIPERFRRSAIVVALLGVIAYSWWICSLALLTAILAAYICYVIMAVRRRIKLSPAMADHDLR